MLNFKFSKLTLDEITEYINTHIFKIDKCSLEKIEADAQFILYTAFMNNLHFIDIKSISDSTIKELETRNIKIEFMNLYYEAIRNFEFLNLYDDLKTNILKSDMKYNEFLSGESKKIRTFLSLLINFHKFNSSLKDYYQASTPCPNYFYELTIEKIDNTYSINKEKLNYINQITKSIAQINEFKKESSEKNKIPNEINLELEKKKLIQEELMRELELIESESLEIENEENDEKRFNEIWVSKIIPDENNQKIVVLKKEDLNEKQDIELSHLLQLFESKKLNRTYDENLINHSNDLRNIQTPAFTNIEYINEKSSHLKILDSRFNDNTNKENEIKVFLNSLNNSISDLKSFCQEKVKENKSAQSDMEQNLKTINREHSDYSIKIQNLLSILESKSKENKEGVETVKF